MGSPSRHRKGGTMTWQGKPAEMQSQGEGLGEGPIPLTTAPGPSWPPQECLGKGEGGRMRKGTYHIQGLPMGVGEGAKGRKKTRLRK